VPNWGASSSKTRRRSVFRTNRARPASRAARVQASGFCDRRNRCCRRSAAHSAGSSPVVAGEERARTSALQESARAALGRIRQRLPPDIAHFRAPRNGRSGRFGFLHSRHARSQRRFWFATNSSARASAPWRLPPWQSASADLVPGVPIGDRWIHAMPTARSARKAAPSGRQQQRGVASAHYRFDEPSRWPSACSGATAQGLSKHLPHAGGRQLLLRLAERHRGRRGVRVQAH
jgi:hypothetical protein